MKAKVFMQSVILSTILTLTLATSGCSKKVESDPLVTDVQPAETGDATIPSLNVRVTLSRTALAKPLFYGSDVQYSEVHDKDMDVYLQSLAVGHIPANFKIAGNELQLVADQRRLFPSDVNHPEKMIARFPVVASDAKTVTIETSRASLYLHDIIAEKKETTPQESWVRSFEFVAKDNLILQETSIRLATGMVVNVMESIMPQENLKASASFAPIMLNPADKRGSIEKGDLPSKYMTIPGEKIREGEDEYAMANKFDVEAGQTIDWYVTTNAPEKYLNAIRAGVEGWNRYFKKMKGIERDVVMFKGYMPKGMKLGDPRFNIINWDSRLIAGAAYESQASDPFTGKQSHSLIYLPAAWVEIGKKYWAGGQYSERSEKSGSVSAKAHAKASKLVKLACLREIDSAAGLLYSGVIPKTSVESFGEELLKAVLFHEVGHALGLGHNFKGSLSYDPAKPDSMFSTSIMDYNAYNLEKDAFYSLESADGPLLEYDRRAISALYNNGKDISEENEKNPLPACNDEVADNEEGGVDPLCTRYDIESDPTHSIDTAIALIDQELIEGRVTLADAMRRAMAEVLTAEEKAKLVDQKASIAWVKTLSARLMASVRFFVLQDTASLSRAVRTNIKTLYIFEKDVLPATYKADEMRERVFKGVERALGMTDFPRTIAMMLDAAREQIKLAITESKWVEALGDNEDQAMVYQDLALKAFNESLDEFKKDPASGLARLRVAVLATLVRKPAASFFLGKMGPKDGQKLVDFETSIISLLTEIVTNKERLAAERLVAAQSLLTYKGRKPAEAAIKGAIDKIELERATVETNEARDSAEALIKVLKEEPKKDEEKKK